MSCLARVASIVLSVLCVTAAWSAESSRFAQTLSRSNYVHWIDLYDANNRKKSIPPTRMPSPTRP